MLPNSNSAFDRFGAYYNVTKVLTPEHTLDEAAYRAYSPIYYSAGYNLVFGAYFAQYTAALVHAVLDHGTQLKTGFRIAKRTVMATFSKKHQIDEAEELRNRMDFDVHYTLMKKYPEAKQWWFASVSLVSLVLGIVACEVYKTTMPVWMIVVAFLMAALFIIPAGIIMAVSVSLATLERCGRSFVEYPNHPRRLGRDHSGSGDTWTSLCQHDHQDVRCCLQISVRES
jgi:hypothetical protein